MCNWNGNASANNAAGIGGLALNTVAAASPFLSTYALTGFAGAGDVVSANFGDAAFSGAVPNTFTSGFTAPVAGPTLNAITTQLTFEEWVSNANCSRYSASYSSFVLTMDYNCTTSATDPISY